MRYHYLNNTDEPGGGGGGGGTLGTSTVWPSAETMTFPTESLRNGDLITISDLGLEGSSGTFRYDLDTSTWFLIYGVFATSGDMETFTTNPANDIAADAILIISDELGGGLIS